MDQVTHTSLEGHKWYWNYQYPYLISNDYERLNFYLNTTINSDLIINCEDNGSSTLKWQGCHSMNSSKNKIGKCIHIFRNYNIPKVIVGLACTLGDCIKRHVVTT